MKKFKLSRRSLKNLKGVNKDAITLIKRVLDISPYDFGIPKYGGFRTAQEQNNLYHMRPRVTWLDGFKRKSYHQSSNAWDIFIWYKNKACWDCIDKYKKVAELFKKEFNKMKGEGFFKGKKLRWGGDFKRWKDLPHFEIRDE